MGDFTFRIKKCFIHAVRTSAVASLLLILALNTVRAQTPVASFNADTTLGCAPLTVTFINTSLLATNYYWRFGNGNTSTLQNPSATYSLPGFYSVTLIATNSSSGQVDSVTMTNYIHVVNYPTANFVANDSNICRGETVCFNNSSVSATGYAWDFGDGNSSTLTNPCHQYNVPGAYTVKLIAYSNFNCNDIKIKTSYIVVNSLPIAQINCNQTSSCDVNQVFSFSCPTSGGTSWQWNFGDPGSGASNTSTLQNPTHVFSAIGSYTVSLIVTNAAGCKDTLVNTNYITIGNSLVPNFTVNSAGGCAPFAASFNCPIPNAVSWSWNFGDPGSGASNTSSSQSPNHIYTNPGQYTITLSVNTSSGCNGTATYTNYITVDQMPVAGFTITNNSGCAPATIQFNNTSSSSATSYLWYFGDGDSSTQQSPSHIYTSTGTYTVTLHAYTPNGCDAVYTMNNAVTVNGAVAGFSATPRTGCAPMNVNFTANTYAGTVSWLWNFGDPSSGAANTSTLQLPSHNFTSTGLYNVQLIITTTNGCTDTFKINAYVKVYSGQDPHPPVTFQGCTPLPVSFTDPTLGSNMWHWDFGDSTLTNDTSNIRNPSYTYTVPGVYVVTLQTNMPGGVAGVGCQQFFNPYATVTVLELIPSPITFVQVSNCSPYQINFSDTTANVATWNWDFGDGTTDTVQFPVHSYQNPGTYQVTLNIVTVNGCMTSLSTSVTVGNTNPINISNHGPCKNASVSFSVNNASAFSNVIWDFGDGSGTTTAFTVNHAYITTGVFPVSLSTTDNLGCVYIYHDTIRVSNPVASFTVPGSLVGCDSLSISFNNTSTGATSYLWQFGDGDSSAVQNPVHTYTGFGTYTVTLFVTSNNCTKSYSYPTQLTVGTAVADFNLVQNSFCDPVSATFTDMSINPVTWHWDFGNGDTSNLQNPSYVFTAAPSSNITLTITDNNGCVDSIAKPNVTFLHASASVSGTSGCQPYTVTFTDQSDTSAVAWHWDFGDGTTTSAQNPAHVFTSPHDTTYTVMLVTTFASGCSDTVIYPNLISVGSPQAEFITPTVAVCAPSLINFTNLSTQAVSYQWDFGDLVTSTLSDPAHIYNIPGYYTITLIATNAMGCSDTMIKTDYIYIPGTYSYFTTNTLSYCFGTTVQFSDSSINATQWHWDFGDGYSDSVQNPLHVYADTGCYAISLITSDSIGCSSIYTSPNPVCVHPVPTSNATTSDTVGCKSYTVQFTELAQNEIAYMWYFGDGDTSSLANPSHIYDAAGIYNVQLVSYNTWGCTDTFNLPNPITVHQTPVAAFSPATLSGCNPLNVSFLNNSSDTVNAVYSWTFGDGQSSSLTDPSNIYADSGYYTVQLVVQNTGNCSDTTFTHITVHKTPTAAATTLNVSGCSPFTASFTNATQNAASYLWSFGDNTTDTAFAPVHVYADSGIYTVQLIAYAAFGCSDTFNFAQPIIVNKTPVASFTPASLVSCAPVNVNFNNTSHDTIFPAYSWTFDTLGTSAAVNPFFSFADSGTYVITLVVTNQGGCSDTIIHTVQSLPQPTAIASTTDTLGCSPMSTYFSNNSISASNYLWNFGDNTTDTAATPTHVYAAAGTYNIYLVAYNTIGCTDTAYITTPVNVLLTPAANFTVANSAQCSGSMYDFTNLSTDTLNPVYFWQIGTSLTSAASDPSVQLVNPGFYDISLNVTNSNGCADTLTKPFYILVYDTMPPPADPIQSVSVVDDYSVRITWFNSIVTDLGAYELYRLDPSSGNYISIYVDSNPSNASLNPTSSYIDTGLNTLQNTYTYKLQTLDRCSYRLPLDSLSPHTTVNITAVTAGKDIDLSWTPYGGCTIASYLIHRTEVGSGVSTLVGTVPGNQLFFTDTTLQCPFPYAYRIEGIDLCGDTATTWSDTSAAIPVNQLANQHADVVRSTVVFNRSILTEWAPPTLHPERVVAYNIMRSTDSIYYVLIAQVPVGNTSYVDDNVFVDLQNYYYHIDVVNDCNMTGSVETFSSSVLLQGEWVNDRTHLWWTRYDKWDNGVDHYSIEKLNKYGQWEEIKIVPGNSARDIELDE